MKLPHKSLRSLGLDHEGFLPVRAHATKIILKAAKFVVFLSSYIGNGNTLLFFLNMSDNC